MNNPSLFTMLCRNDRKSQVCSRCKLCFKDSLKNNGTKYLLFFDDSCEEICKAKAFVDVATARRHHGLSTFYNKHNLFHQSKLGRVFWLQKLRIFMFKSPSDVTQVSTLSALLGLGSELVDWYRYATSIPYCHYLMDLSPQTDDRLRYCTNTGSISSKFYLPDRLEQSENLDDKHTKFLFFRVFQSFSHKCKSLFLQSCPNEFIRFLCECIVNLHKGNLQSIETHDVTKFQNKNLLPSFKRNTWKHRTVVLATEKG